MSAPFRFPKFFVTSPSPCPYLPGKVERKVFTELGGHHPTELNEALGRIGFRRSQSVAYRPSCIDCSACVSVRVLAQEFEPTRTQRKLLRKHADLEVTACKPWTTEEQYALLRRYLSARHPGGGMAEMDENDFADMVEQSPVRTYVVEYREPSVDGRPGKLVGACLSDQQGDGLSMIYSFYDPDGDRQGLGTFIILDHIIRAARAGLPYVYLGYWVEGSDRMNYKAGFRPLERLDRDGWRRFDAPRIEQAVDLSKLPSRRERSRLFVDA
ncbi:arginyltransferase [Sphingomonas ginkgonis]|uniref:Aspartate/glutamate leucyltransferase n=1 Tax=Sphingomonas ginkgonis TaxID=2315330 RepID=A0A3R9WTZ0_9SPHN|nr:arginyltransferase [Sphingomonas ginkgonis]RST31771.1 arginyltransferase [Sphingomonas ginkgonis]